MTYEAAKAVWEFWTAVYSIPVLMAVIVANLALWFVWREKLS